MKGESNRLCMRRPNNGEETGAKRPYFIAILAIRVLQISCLE